MTQIEYCFYKGKNSEAVFGKYRYDEEIAKLERVPVTDIKRIELFLKAEFPKEQIIVGDTFNKKIID